VAVVSLVSTCRLAEGDLNSHKGSYRSLQHTGGK